MVPFYRHYVWFETFEHLIFGFVSYFDIRISNLSQDECG